MACSPTTRTPPRYSAATPLDRVLWSLGSEHIDDNVAVVVATENIYFFGA